MGDLQQRIIEHGEAMAALSYRVDQLLAGIEQRTAEAREMLGRYQGLKREASVALAGAGDAFHAAQRGFRRADDLFADLHALKDIHVALSLQVNQYVQREQDPEQARRVLSGFMQIRRALRRTHKQIEKCSREARMAERAIDEDRGQAGAEGEPGRAALLKERMMSNDSQRSA